MATKLTKVSFNKLVETRKGFRLRDKDLWPITLIVEVEGITVKAQFTCPNGNDFELSINNVPYLELKYKATVKSSAQCKTVGMSGRIILNG